MAYKIYEACSKGNLSKVKECLENPQTKKKELLSTFFSDSFFNNRTLLHTAALNGHDKIVKLLLDHGAKVNCSTLSGNYSALHLAVHGKHKSCVEVLLRKDIDVTARDESEKTAYEHALEASSKDSPIPVVLKTAEVMQAARGSNHKNLKKLLQSIDENEISDDCFSQALLQAVNKDEPNHGIIEVILMRAAAQNASLDILTCINICFQQEPVDIKLAWLLMVCWMAKENQSEQLAYFLGTLVDWIPLQSDDRTLDELVSLYPQQIQLIRNELQRQKCINIAPAITMAITCNSTSAAQLLLTHGSIPQNERTYNIDWNDLQLSTLPPEILGEMYHRRQFSGKGLGWDQITQIDLRNNSLTEVPRIVFKLPLLTTLRLSRNKLKTLPEVKKVSKSLNHLYLSNNLLKDLPDAYAQSNLRTLKLDNNLFEFIPKCVLLIATLETLEVHGNYITVLPLGLGRLTKLTTFKYDKDKISWPLDWSKHCESDEELIQWLRSLLLKAAPFKTIKLLVIGWQGKGKTTLVHRLRNDLEYNRNVSDRTITKGVEVSEMKMQSKVIAGLLPTGPRITFQVWDFAGQKDFHLMHMCFLPSIGLYILVWNLMDGRQGIQEMKDWLDNISCHQTSKATVIIVGTHLDCVKETYSKNDVRQYIGEMRGFINDMTCDYSNRNVRFADVVEVSCNVADSDGVFVAASGISDLKRKIVKASGDIIRDKGIRVLDEPVPTWFHKMVKSIEALRSSMSVPIVNRERLEALMRDVSGHEDLMANEFDEAVAFLKDRGNR